MNVNFGLFPPCPRRVAVGAAVRDRYAYTDRGGPIFLVWLAPRQRRRRWASLGAMLVPRQGHTTLGAGL